MLTQELRIFNYIDKVKKSEDDFNDYYKVKRISYNEHRNEETSVIDCIGNKHGYFSFLISGWQPIELTEEWLLRFGFEKLTICWYGLIVHNVGGHIISIEINENGRLAFSSNKNWVEFVHPHRIKYVHQMQNIIYSLTNKELKLKDEK